MRFTKMHGAGNDYVFVDLFEETLPEAPPNLARSVSSRHAGIGGDGLILIGPSERAVARMQIWNADGSPAEMCGNGLRCVAKYLFDRQRVRQKRFSIETGRGVLVVEVETTGGVVHRVRANLDRPVLDAALIPTTLPGSPPLNVSLSVGGGVRRVSAIGMGNPHLVVPVENVEKCPVESWGPELESHPAFPHRTNVEFVQVISRERIHVRVWERGAGETQACGTGACAAVVASALTNQTGRQVVCQLPGGELRVEWSSSGDLFLTGPAEEVYSGDYFPASHRGAAAA